MKFVCCIYVLCFCLTPLLLSAQSPGIELSGNQCRSAAVKYSTGYPDLDLYYWQLENNTYHATTARRGYLLETTPLDSLIMDFIRKGYSTFNDTISLYHYFNYFYAVATKDELQGMVDKMHFFARKYKNKRLELLADTYKGDIMPWGNEKEWIDKEGYHENIIRKSRKSGDIEIEAIILDGMRRNNFFSNRYARSFAYARRLAEMLEKIDDDFTLKSKFIVDMGKAYYGFKDYEQALPFFYKVPGAEAWDYLASYHRMNHNLDSAAYYYRKILTHGRDINPPLLAIAISNLGRIELENGNTDAALAMLESGLGYMKEHCSGDSDFIFGQHVSLGEVYLKKGDMKAVRDHIAAAENQPEHIGFNAHRRRRNLYALKSSYYGRTGQYDLAHAFRDSALAASAEYEQNTGKHLILLGEQQLQLTEIDIKAQQVARQRNIILFTLVILTILSVGIIIIFRLYRRRNAAYKVLAHKAEQWAQGAKTEVHPIPVTPRKITANLNKPTTQEDLRIMDLADREMMQNYAYRESGLTAEQMADRLGVHRNTFSRAVNHTTGGNFNNYINGYRIKEAIRIISETDRSQLYIEQIYDSVGFGNRNSFYRAFKLFTGLTPSEFRKSKDQSTDKVNF